MSSGFVKTSILAPSDNGVTHASEETTVEDAAVKVIRTIFSFRLIALLLLLPSSPPPTLAVLLSTHTLSTLPASCSLHPW